MTVKKTWLISLCALCILSVTALAMAEINAQDILKKVTMSGIRPARSVW